MDFDRWLADLEAKVADTQSKSAELIENLGNTTARETSPDGTVTVVVGANGALQNVELSPRIAEFAPAQLGALIMKTVHKAQRAVAGKVSEELQPFDDSGELLERYVSELPPEEADSSPSSTEFGMPETPEPTAPASRTAPSTPARPRPRITANDDDENESRPW